jgi:Zinc knuckle./Retrotransposon gag protein.
MSTHSSNVKVAKPDDFDGDPRKFQNWLIQILLYVMITDGLTDEKKIGFTLSYMKNGTADAWKKRRVVEAAAKSPPEFGTWVDFVKDLKVAFEDKTIKQRAREKMENFKQRGRVDPFINQFEITATEAGIESNDAEMIRLLQRATDHEIIKAIYGSGEVPDTFADYRAKVIKFGRLFEQWKDQQKGYTDYTSRPAPTPARPAHTPREIPRDRPTTTGVTYAGRGVPMEIDAVKKEHRCFNCKELGHFRRECPKPKTKINIRALLTDLDDDERQEILGGLTAPQEPVLHDHEQDFDAMEEKDFA